MVECPNEMMAMRNKDKNSQRIAALEEKVSDQAQTIEELQRQLQALSTVFSNANILFANAAHCLAAPGYKPNPSTYQSTPSAPNYQSAPSAPTSNNSSDTTFTCAAEPEEYKSTRNPEEYKSTRNPEEYKSTRNPEECKSTRNPEEYKSTRNPEECKSTRNPEEYKAKDNKKGVMHYNYKNLLQEHCVKQGWTFPAYETSRCSGGFNSVIVLSGETYTSEVMKSKVLAEKSAACILLKRLSVIDTNGIPVGDGESGRVSTGVSKYSWCKNQLQEYFAKCGHSYPSYNISTAQGRGFTAEVSHETLPEKVLGPVAYSKRAAEQMAAHKAISVWKILELGG